MDSDLVDDWDTLEFSWEGEGIKFLAANNHYSIKLARTVELDGQTGKPAHLAPQGNHPADGKTKIAPIMETALIDRAVFTGTCLFMVMSGKLSGNEFS